MKKIIAVAMFVLGLASVSSANYEYAGPPVTPPVAIAVSDSELVTVEDMDASINAVSKNIRGSIVKSRNIEARHYKDLKKENNEIRRGIKNLADSNRKEFSWLGDQAYSHAWLLGILIVLAAILVIVAVIVMGRRSERGIVTVINDRFPVQPQPIVAPNAPAEPIAAPAPVAMPAPNAAPVVAPVVQNPQDPATAQSLAAVAHTTVEILQSVNDGFASVGQQIAEARTSIPIDTANRVKKLDPETVLVFTITDGANNTHEVTYKPEIVNTAAGERFKSLYVPKSVTGIVPANPAEIVTVPVGDAGRLQDSVKSVMIDYFNRLAAVAAPTGWDEHQYKLIQHMIATKRLVLL